MININCIILFRLVLIELQFIAPESFIGVYETSLTGKRIINEISESNVCH